MKRTFSFYFDQQNVILKAQNEVLKVQNDVLKVQNEVLMSQNEVFVDENDGGDAHGDERTLVHKRSCYLTVFGTLFWTLDYDVLALVVEHKIVMNSVA